MAKPFSRSSSSSDASHRLVASRCPECGAPVDFRSVPRDQTQVKCVYCGTLIAIPGRTQPHTPEAASPPTIVVTSDGSLVKGGWGCNAVGWMVVILIIFVTGIGVWSTSFITSATRVVSDVVKNDSESDLPSFRPLTLPTISLPLAPKPRLSTAPVVLGGNDTSPTQMVVAATQEDGALLFGFDPEKRAETWRSPLLSEKYYEMGVGADAARVYVADGATLMALDRSSGQIVWQTSLANNIQTSCAASDPCLQTVGDQVVTLARDGTVQAFAGATGAPLWSRRLNSQPRQFLANNDQVILVDNDERNRALVLILNATNGDLIHELEPSCSFPNIDMRPHSSDQFLVTPDGSALLVVGSGTYACAWRYNMSDGALTWSYISPDVNGPLPFTWSMSSLAVADPMVYFVKEEGDDVILYALDSSMAGSTPQPLYSIQDYELTVQYPLGDLLLVSAQPDYAREEVELWAINRSSGERRWQRKLETTHTFDDWVTRPTDTGIFLTVCSWNDDGCRFEVLDLSTGASKGQVRQATGTFFSGAAWLGNRGYLTIDGKIYAIDLATATVAYTWP